MIAVTISIAISIALLIVGYLIWRIDVLSREVAQIRPSVEYLDAKDTRQKVLDKNLDALDQAQKERAERLDKKGVSQQEWDDLLKRIKKVKGEA